jgi:hypothetical protein
MQSIDREERSVASFPGFAWPKTKLQRGTEHGLTSEFGKGSGGTRALWPANNQPNAALTYINLSLPSNKTCSFRKLSRKGKTLQKIDETKRKEKKERLTSLC